MLCISISVSGILTFLPNSYRPFAHSQNYTDDPNPAPRTTWPTEEIPDLEPAFKTLGTLMRDVVRPSETNRNRQFLVGLWFTSYLHSADTRLFWLLLRSIAWSRRRSPSTPPSSTTR